MKLKVLVWMVLACICLGTACRSLPEPPEERALYIDLRQVVETRERGEWILDEKELEEARPKAMLSVCRVSPQTVEGLERWLDEQLSTRGGTPSKQHAEGADLGELDEEFTLERVRSLASYTNQSRDECPFWLAPDGDFDGIHRPTDRFVFLAESAGVGSLIVQGGDTLLGAGGAGRLFAAWGIGHRYLLGFGGEIGGAAGLEPLTAQDDKIETRIHAAVPVMFRVYDLTRFYDVELAATALASPADFDPSFGVRAQVGVGLLTVRISQFLPYFSVIAGYEILPFEDEAIHAVRVGTRFGVDFDPGSGDL
ncbi:hypothetical protein FIV42_29055 [Persicimonas caeni]|uniref:Uncharacterized protein n=1 Tax=Persicimonas caeni TaxID=2292766 RepID=A0A4Y6Q3A7_PERCE|nr:hypothetical protein [Persicimonas caeni]QDG54647.1 hypothetical protein FIV42_29055 [Persicimonas caeni]QED35868.1 hypothetical protein FRD00_29050 [Persicimonas caeni]